MENGRSGHAGYIRELKLRCKIIPIFLDDGFIPFVPEFDTGIDLIIYRERDDLLIKVQLKSRWSIDRKYIGRGFAMAFPAETDSDWYLVPHDEMVGFARNSTSYLASASWREQGIYHRRAMSRAMLQHFDGYRLGETSLNEKIYAHYIGTRKS